MRINRVQILFISVFVFSVIPITIAQNYSGHVLRNLNISGINASELKKVLMHYKNEPEKLQAAYFLIENMDCHNSQSYYWTDVNKQKVPFDEFRYVSYEEAVKAFNKIAFNRQMIPVEFTVYDLAIINAKYLIVNIDEAFIVWKKKWSSKLSFEMFCEYILPYRIMDEPFTEWRESYKKVFASSFSKCANLRVRDVCTLLSNEYKNWFSDIFNLQVKKEKQHVLSPQQILFRRQGYCEDMANWGVYMLRSLGIASCVDYTPYWATSTGGHFWQVAFNEIGENIPFFMGDDTPAEFFMRREPSKVLRITYSKQETSPLLHVSSKEIPDGFLRRSNFIDVTDQYWKTASFVVSLYRGYMNDKK